MIRSHQYCCTEFQAIGLLNFRHNTDIPVFEKIPLPATGAGDQRGVFAYPKVGALVEIGFMFGHPDKPFIRTVLVNGVPLPALQSNDVLLAQDAGNFYRIDSDHSITENAQGSQEITIGGNRSLTVLGSDTETTGMKTVNVEGNHTDIATAMRKIEAQVIQLQGSASVTIQAPAINLQAGSIAMGTGGGGTDVLQVLSDLCDVVSRIASTTANHSHPNLGAAPSTSGAHSSQYTEASELKTLLAKVML